MLITFFSFIFVVIKIIVMAAIIPKIRAGNQFTYLWAIERAGVAVDLTTATDIELSYGVGKLCADYSKIPFTAVDTNKISSSHLYGVTGTYNLKLEFKIDGEQSTIDIDAFKIVPRSEDASESTQFAVTSDMAIGFKGEKGDKLTFTDLTPSDIAELQQPANDAIASIQAVEATVSGNENNRVDAEYDRNQEEINRQEQEVARQANTGTAIQNANTATTNANNAATLANTKAGLADTAATNANNVANGYAAELALKELKSNKQNSLTTDGTGVKFPTVDAVNGGLGGKQATLVSGTNIKTVNGQSIVGSGNVSNLIGEFTYNENKEVAVTAIDLATGTFTKIGHGFVNGDNIYPILNLNVNIAFPLFVFPTNLDCIRYYVVNSTADTFQISLTNGGSAVTFTANSDMNLTKWHFEKPSNWFAVTGLSEKAIKVIYTGKTLGNNLSITPDMNVNWNLNTWTELGNISSLSTTGSVYVNVEIYIYIKEKMSYQAIGQAYKPLSKIKNTYTPIDIRAIRMINNTEYITNITVTSSENSINGNKISIYRL